MVRVDVYSHFYHHHTIYFFRLHEPLIAKADTIPAYELDTGVVLILFGDFFCFFGFGIHLPFNSGNSSFDGVCLGLL